MKSSEHCRHFDQFPTTKINRNLLKPIWSADGVSNWQTNHKMDFQHRRCATTNCVSNQVEFELPDNNKPEHVTKLNARTVKNVDWMKEFEMNDKDSLFSEYRTHYVAPRVLDNVRHVYRKGQLVFSNVATNYDSSYKRDYVHKQAEYVKPFYFGSTPLIDVENLPPFTSTTSYRSQFKRPSSKIRAEISTNNQFNDNICTTKPLSRNYSLHPDDLSLIQQRQKGCEGQTEYANHFQSQMHQKTHYDVTRDYAAPKGSFENSTSYSIEFQKQPSDIYMKKTRPINIIDNSAVFNYGYNESNKSVYQDNFINLQSSALIKKQMEYNPNATAMMSSVNHDLWWKTQDTQPYLEHYKTVFSRKS